MFAGLSFYWNEWVTHFSYDKYQKHIAFTTNNLAILIRHWLKIWYTQGEQKGRCLIILWWIDLMFTFITSFGKSRAKFLQG